MLQNRLPGFHGQYVPLKTTINDFEEIINGTYDHLPEDAFYMVGTLEQVKEKAQKLKTEV